MKVPQELIIEACQTALTMAEAHRKVCETTVIKYNTFAKYAKNLGCYVPNQGSKGRQSSRKRPVTDYLGPGGLFITSHRLKLKLIDAGLKLHKCEICGITEWNGVKAPIELDHIDGNHTNNSLDNLRILCPNCHAQTDTNSGKRNKKQMGCSSAAEQRSYKPKVEISEFSTPTKYGDLV